MEVNRKVDIAQELGLNLKDAVIGALSNRKQQDVSRWENFSAHVHHLRTLDYTSLHFAAMAGNINEMDSKVESILLKAKVYS